jgi:hypothetical protein
LAAAWRAPQSSARGSGSNLTSSKSNLDAFEEEAPDVAEVDRPARMQHVMGTSSRTEKTRQSTSSSPSGAVHAQATAVVS